MALTRIKTWISGEVLTHTDLNSEIDNLINNALSLISPLTGNLDFSTFSLFAASPTIVVTPEDARTATVDVGLVVRSTTSGTPAASIGTGIQVDAESADENPSVLGRLDFVFTDVTAASEDSVLDVLLRTAGAAAAARYRFEATGAFLATITHALTAARTITIPDTTGTLALTADKLSAFAATTSAELAGVISDETGSGLLVFGTAPTLGAPVIADFTSAAHDHGDTDDGGAIVGGMSTTRRTTDFTTTSATFVDVTTHSITFTTRARRVLLTLSGTVQTTAAGGQVALTFDIDGTDAGGASGLMVNSAHAANVDEPVSMSYMTDVLTAASHTFKVNLASLNGVATANLVGNPHNTFSATEMPY